MLGSNCIMPTDQTPANCPACHTPAHETLWATTAVEAAQAFLRVESSPIQYAQLAQHIESLWGQPTCTILRCQACGLGFAHPFVGGDARFYNLAYPGTPGYPRNKWEFRQSIGDVRSKGHVPLAQARCLEVGSGVGNFLVQLAAQGAQPGNITALEYNEQSVRVLRERGFNGQAIDIRCLSTVESFDHIFMFQVVEHMDSLDEVFAQVAKLLGPKGSVYIAMPNQTRLTFNEQHGALLDMPPNHISRWTRLAVEKLVARHGLVVHAFEVEAGALGKLIKQDLSDYTLRRSMTPGTLASRVYRPEQGMKRKLRLAAAASVYALRRWPLWLRHAGQVHELGGSIWAKIGHDTATATLRTVAPDA